MKFFLTLNFFFCLNQIVNGFLYNDTIFLDVISKNINAHDYYYRSFNLVINLMKLISTDNRIDLECKNSYLKLIDGLEKKDVWALKFYESIGTTVNGKLLGHNFNYGSFDYCYNFEKQYKDNIDFDGKYCLITVHTPETKETKKLPAYQENLIGLRNESADIVEFGLGSAHGICIPSTCDINQLAVVVNDRLSSLELKIMTPKYCSTKKGESFSILQIIILCVFGIFFVLCFTSLCSKKKFLENFSVTKNYKLIYGKIIQKDENSMNFVYGLKTVMILCSIATHTIGVFLLIFPYFSSTYKEITISPVLASFLQKLLVLGDQMFLFGGFFCMFSWYNYIVLNKNQFSFLKYFLMRYVKIFISSIIFMMVIIILPQLGNGPFYTNLTNHIADNCKFGFWKIFLLYSNEDKVIDMCSIPTWYFSADFQIYILHFFIIYYLVVRPKLGLIILIIQFLANSAFNIFFNYYNSNRPFIDLMNTDLYSVHEVEKIYFHSFYHYNTYTLGVLVAWFVKSQNKPKFLKNKFNRIAGFFITLFLSLSVFWVPILIDLQPTETKTIKSIVWPVLEKIIFSLFLCWCFFNLAFGYFNPIRRIITTKFFVSWSKLLFSLTISQFIFILYFTGTTRTTFNYSLFAFIKEFSSFCLGTWFVALFLFIIFEAPMSNLINNLIFNFFGIKKRRNYKLDNIKKTNKIELKEEFFEKDTNQNLIV